MVGAVYSSVGRAEAVPAREYKQQWRTVVKHLKTLCRYAGDRGIKICMEPINRFETDFINTCDQALNMAADVGSPHLLLHLDTFHMNIEEKNQAAAIRKAGKLLGHFHSCGSDRGTPGSDHIDWTGIARRSKRSDTTRMWSSSRSPAMSNSSRGRPRLAQNRADAGRDRGQRCEIFTRPVEKARRGLNMKKVLTVVCAWRWRQRPAAWGWRRVSPACSTART